MPAICIYYRAQDQKTSFYAGGHFDKPFWHFDSVTGEVYLFERTSFRILMRMCVCVCVYRCTKDVCVCVGGWVGVRVCVRTRKYCLR